MYFPQHIAISKSSSLVRLQFDMMYSHELLMSTDVDRCFSRREQTFSSTQHCGQSRIMRAILVKDGKGPISNLFLGETEKPSPKPGEVLVKVCP